MIRLRFPALACALALLASCDAGDSPNLAEAAEPPAPPAAERRESDAPEPPVPQDAAAAAGEPVSACLKQDGERIPANRLKAIGTEPFWGAEIEGRCVTYSTPEDQDGTRVWTQFSGSGESGTWTGYLDNQRFVLRTRPQPGCSDGMSDNRYPIAVTLTVRGEERTGCARPL